MERQTRNKMVGTPKLTAGAGVSGSCPLQRLSRNLQLREAQFPKRELSHRMTRHCLGPGWAMLPNPCVVKKVLALESGGPGGSLRY